MSSFSIGSIIENERLFVQIVQGRDVFDARLQI
jgi:hypothetical protein